MNYEADFSRHTQLSDGTPVHLRMIRPDDAEGIREGVKNMSAESRYRRFLTSVQDIPDSLLTYLTEVDGHDHVAMVCETVADEERDGRIVGVARYVRDEGCPEAAEAAVAVADELQRRGMATMLLADLSGAARERGIERFTALISPENDPVKALIDESGLENTSSAVEGATVYNLKLPEADEESIRSALIYKVLKASASADKQAKFIFRHLSKPIKLVKKPIETVKAAARSRRE